MKCLERIKLPLTDCYSEIREKIKFIYVCEDNLIRHHKHGHTELTVRTTNDTHGLRWPMVSTLINVMMISDKQYTNKV